MAFCFLLLVSGILILSTTAATAQTSQNNRTPVLIELFTSEGCSSCPPADVLLGKLSRDQPVPGAEIIVLEEHVDYWDNLGWHDRFSSHQYTDRQTQYSTRLHEDNGVYTPQMIVDGTDQFVGNDAAHAQRAIQHAAQTSKFSLTLSQPVADGHKISASISTAAPATNRPQADLYAALVDLKDSTEVRSGENGGHNLQHVNVVRTMQRVGSLKNLTSGPLSFTLTAPADAKPDEMRLIVFAQQSGQGAVLGAVSTLVTH